MIPGMVSKLVEGIPVASAATITLRMGEVFRVSGSTQINTINGPLMGQNHMIFLIPVDGPVVLGSSGNIHNGLTMNQNRVTSLVYIKSTARWYIDNGA